MLIHQRIHRDTPADERLRADIAGLSTALAVWSGTTADQVLRHLRRHADQDTADDWPSAVRCAAAAFSNDIAADLALQLRTQSANTRPAPPSPAPCARLK